MRLRSLTLRLALLGIFAMPLASLAQQEGEPQMPPGPPHESMPHHPGWGVDRHEGMMMGHHEPSFLHGLHLSEQQQDKVFSILHDLEPSLRNEMKSAQAAAKDLRALVMSDAYDDKKAKAAADKLAHAHAEIALLHARSAHQIYALLTPEQKQQIEEQRRAHEQHEHDGHDGHDGHDHEQHSQH